MKHEIEFDIEQVDQSQISTVKMILSDEGITLKTSPCVFFFSFFALAISQLLGTFRF